MSAKSVRNTIENVWNPLGRQRRISSGGPQFWRLPVLVFRNKNPATQCLFKVTRQGKGVEALTMFSNRCTVYNCIFELLQLKIKDCCASTQTFYLRAGLFTSGEALESFYQLNESVSFQPHLSLWNPLKRLVTSIARVYVTRICEYTNTYTRTYPQDYPWNMISFYWQRRKTKGDQRATSALIGTNPGASYGSPKGDKMIGSQLSRGLNYTSGLKCKTATDTFCAFSRWAHVTSASIIKQYKLKRRTNK